MKKLLLLFVLGFTLISCEERFTKEKYDVLLTFQNTSDKSVDLFISETNNRIHWKKTSLLPDEFFEVKFNIKEDIKASEGGFVLKAVFPDGSFVEKNMGYYTNFQYQGANPGHIGIAEDGFYVKF